MNEEKKDIIKKLYLLWEIDRLHQINECDSMEEYLEQEEELKEMKEIIRKEFDINL